MNAFKIDKSKIEALNTRYEEKAKEMNSLQRLGLIFPQYVVR